MASVLLLPGPESTIVAPAPIKPSDHAARHVAPNGWPQRSARVRALRAHTRPRAAPPPPFSEDGQSLGSESADMRLGTSC